MKVLRFKSCVFAISLCLLAGSALGQSPGNEPPLTNAAVVKLVKAGFKEKTVITIIGSRPSNFELSAERMIDLKRAGVSEKIILAMLAQQQGFAFDDNWNDDAFFSQGNNQPLSNDPLLKQNDRSTPSAPGNSTDIFGSSGGARGNTKSRGGNATSDGETVTTGSATVRILRPPAEAGATPKLERVATLNNESIMELIEAGFSEGTIIRRIEQSPVEFDLSPAKLAKLRKHRVTEKILSAMKAASGETEDPKAMPGSNGMSRQ